MSLRPSWATNPLIGRVPTTGARASSHHLCEKDDAILYKRRRSLQVIDTIQIDSMADLLDANSLLLVVPQSPFLIDLFQRTVFLQCSNSCIDFR